MAVVADHALIRATRKKGDHSLTMGHDGARRSVSALVDGRLSRAPMPKV